MRCAICDSVLQLHSRSDICQPCHHSVLQAGQWFYNPLDLADSDLRQQAIHVEQEEEETD